MGADLSRIRSNPLLDFSGVELKQGGVVLDADVNELVAVLDRRLRAAASDILGRSTVSQTTPDAFKITVAGSSLQIGKGRLYVDGLLAENHGAESTDPAKRIFDPLMAEPAFAEPIDYTAQPYLPEEPGLPEAGRHLVYLDVWQREVTHLERPDLVETAVGVETSSRLQTVWQVRVLAEDTRGATCATPDDELSGWAALIAPSTGRLTTGTFDVPPAEDPCELPPTGGYRGLENQTYRVEIQDPGQPGGGATFKWSRENASVGSRVASMVSATELELQTLGRDDVLRFNTGDWVEIQDDVRELSQRCGEIRRITVNEAARRITFTPALPADMLPVPVAFPDSIFPGDRNLRVRRWDQKGKVLAAATAGTTTTFQDLDAASSTGVVNVPAAGTTLLLENGVTVSFSVVGPKGFRAGDYWVFAARTADASIELLEAAPPRGIHHHYARLAMWDVGGGVTDCRTPWPPPGGDGHDCSCTACVTPESHASGALTIQGAVDRIRETGGTVCLAVGVYQLREPVRLVDARAVRIRGQGAATVIVTPGGAFQIQDSVALAIEDLAVLSLGRATVIRVRTALGLALQRLAIMVVGARDFPGVAISLTGALIAAAIRDNFVVAPVAVQAVDPEAEPTPDGERAPQMLFSAALCIEDNVLWCERRAVALVGRVFHAMATRIAGNEVVGCRQGAITALGLGGPGASLRIANNSLNVTGHGVTAGVDGLWIEGNKLVAAPPQGDQGPDVAGILVRTGLDPTGTDQCQILANQISGFADVGIAVRSPTGALIVKHNILKRCGNGIILDAEANASSVSIENNQVSDIGSVRDERSNALGIIVVRADAATVAGNTISRIGRQAVSAPLRAGIAAMSVRRLRASGNEVTDVAPEGDFVGLAAGVLVRAPYSQAEVTNNYVDRDAEPSSQVSRARWLALMVDAPNPDRVVSRVGTHAAVRLDEARTLVFGGRRPYLVAAAAVLDAAGAAAFRGASASVLGNVLGGRGDSPVALVEATGDCLFNDNRCELRASRNPAVRLAGGATIVNANRVRGGELSMELLGNPRRLTVVGNITTGLIHAGGAPLQPPWDVLNVQG